MGKTQVSSLRSETLGWTIAWILAVGILPSLMAPSSALFNLYPFLGKYIGPVNPLKIMAPILLFGLLKYRILLPKKIFVILPVVLSILIFCSLVSAGICHFPSNSIRDLAAILLGSLAGLSFFLLSRRQIYFVICFWMISLLGGVLLNYFAPEKLVWILTHLFDPARAVEVSGPLKAMWILGFYDNGSLAKLFSWVSWVGIFALLSFSSSLKNLRLLSVESFILLSSLTCVLLILPTSQRGPFFGILGGWIAFVFYLSWLSRSWRTSIRASLVLSSLIVIGLLLTPSKLLKDRYASMVDWSIDNQARSSQLARLKHYQLAFKVIRSNPFGDACIPRSEFEAFEIPQPNHAHSLIVHSYRERGWIWGTIHLVLWVLAIMGSVRMKNYAGAALFAGIITTQIIGLADYTYSVLHHSMLVNIFLMGGLLAYFSNGKFKISSEFKRIDS